MIEDISKTPPTSLSLPNSECGGKWVGGPKVSKVHNSRIATKTCPNKRIEDICNTIGMSIMLGYRSQKGHSRRCGTKPSLIGLCQLDNLLGHRGCFVFFGRFRKTAPAK